MPIRTRPHRTEMEFLLSDYGARLLVFDGALAEAVPAPRHAFSMEGSAGARPFADP